MSDSPAKDPRTVRSEATIETSPRQQPEDPDPDHDQDAVLPSFDRQNSRRSQRHLLSRSASEAKADSTSRMADLPDDDFYAIEDARERRLVNTRRGTYMEFSRPRRDNRSTMSRPPNTRRTFDESAEDYDEERPLGPYTRSQYSPERRDTFRRDDYGSDRDVYFRPAPRQRGRDEFPESDRRYPPSAYAGRRSYDSRPGPSAPAPSSSFRQGTPQHRDYERYEEDPEEEHDAQFNRLPHTEKGVVDFKSLTKEEKKEVLRLPWTQWMGSDIKNHFVAALGEFVGTTLFLFFAFAGTQVANVNSATDSTTTTGANTGFSPQTLLYISLVFGFSLMVNVWVFFRISGGLFNPAVTLAMTLVGSLSIVRAIILFCAQVAGSIAASALVLVMFPTQFSVRTTLGQDVSIVRGLFIEAILTAELVFTILMLAREKHRGTFIAPVGIGLALFIAELVGVFYTGGSLNPARSIGPSIVANTYSDEDWIYWVGPGMGAVFAVVFYGFIKMLEYEVTNPGQDAADVAETLKVSK